jgi:ABC-type antimicrobial peptide transport system permease subunit
VAARNHRESILLALDTLRQHKLRSLLTVLGVVMGVGVLMLVAALLTGFDTSVVETITRFGADTASVTRFRQGPRLGRGRPREERLRKPLTLEDGLALAECCASIRQVTVWITQWEQTHGVRYQGNEVAGVDLRGTLPNYPFVLANTNLVEGRFFTDTENLHRESLVVLGQDTASALFGRLPATGREILVDGQTYRVIGVLARPEGNFGPNDEDRRVLLPYQSFRKAYPSSYENAYRFQARPDRLDAAVDEAREFLRRRRNVPYDQPDTFEIRTATQQIEEFHAIVGLVAVAMVVLSSIGLLIGGVGVMNIMLVSVTERTREIGVRKAVGARRSDIAWQFISEAMALTGAGGIIGMLAVQGLVLLIRGLTTIEASVPLWAVVAGLGVSLGVGLVFGVWPAVKAARLDPVDALRYE